MKKISALLALWVLFFAGLALANTATITSATGTVQAQTGTAPVRVLRVGDLVRQGDTIITGSGSSVVMRFEDGQVNALTANSRMTITAYQYNPQTQSGNVLLSLIDGGMRAITGLIGNRTPNNVAYRAATATIGIRGTDITIVVAGNTIVVTVLAGSISYTAPNGQRVTVGTNEAVASQGQGSPAVAAAAAIIASLPAAVGAEVTNTTQAMVALTQAINQAQQTPPGQTPPPATTIQTTTPTGAGATLVPPVSCFANQTCTCPANSTFVSTAAGCQCNTGFVASGTQCVPGPT